MAEEQVLKDILSVMESEAASQRSRPVKLGNAAVGKQIQQLENAGKVPDAISGLKESLIGITSSLPAITSLATPQNDESEENTEEVSKLNANMGLFSQNITTSLGGMKDSVTKVGGSIKDGAKKTADSLKSVGKGIGKMTTAITLDLASNLKSIGDGIKESAAKASKNILVFLGIAATLITAVKFFQGFFQTEGTLGEKLQAGLKSVLDLLPFKEETKESILGLFTSLGETLQPYIDSIKGFLNPIWENLKIYFKETLLPEVLKAFTFLKEKLADAALGLLDLAKNKAKSKLFGGGEQEVVDPKTREAVIDPVTGETKTRIVKGDGLLEGESGAKIGAVGGALAGAKLGAMIGTIVPGVGNVIGAAVGGLAGAAIGAIAGGIDKGVSAEKTREQRKGRRRGRGVRQKIDNISDEVATETVNAYGMTLTRDATTGETIQAIDNNTGAQMEAIQENTDDAMAAKAALSQPIVVQQIDQSSNNSSQVVSYVDSGHEEVNAYGVQFTKAIGY